MNPRLVRLQSRLYYLVPRCDGDCRYSDHRHYDVRSYLVSEVTATRVRFLRTHPETGHFYREMAVDRHTLEQTGSANHPRLGVRLYLEPPAPPEQPGTPP
jgi:hypothetical protein